VGDIPLVIQLELFQKNPNDCVITYDVWEKGESELPEFFVYDNSAFTITIETSSNALAGNYTIEVVGTFSVQYFLTYEFNLEITKAPLEASYNSAPYFV